jgi:hypothetical protein
MPAAKIVVSRSEIRKPGENARAFTWGWGPRPLFQYLEQCSEHFAPMRMAFSSLSCVPHDLKRRSEAQQRQ